ncbi:MAG: hypothetical protein KJZ93_02915 [Caldilineaceae bacterium]|nr:hypothetical protein [Caldilineaceae bacterium]
MSFNQGRLALLTTAIALLLLTGCQPTPAAPGAPETPAATAPGLPEPASADLSQLPPVQMAMQVLRQQLHLDFDAVELVSVDAVEWPDACLGVSLPERLCAQMITPGYRIVLRAAGQTYEYRTDEAGNRIELAAAPEPTIEPVALRWRQLEESCKTATFGLQSVAFGPCGGAMLTTALIAEMNRPQELADFVATYAAFTADTPAGEITLSGRGAEEATPAEQRMIAEWARLAALEAEAGRGGASWGLVLALHEEGDDPPHCRDVAIYATGVAYAVDCAGDTPVTLGEARLDAAQLPQLYIWLDSLAPFEDRAVDGAGDWLLLSGAGAKPATPDDKAAMRALARTIYAHFAGNSGVTGSPALTGEIKTHTDEQVGFAFDYPADWTLYGADNPGATLTWSSESGGAGVGGALAGMTKFDVVVRPAEGQTLDQIAAARKEEVTAQGGRLLAEERRVLPSGLPAVWLQADAFGLTTLLVTEINGHEVLFAAFGDLAPFEAVMQTLRYR